MLDQRTHAVQELPASCRQALCKASDAELIDHHKHCLAHRPSQSLLGVC